MGLSRHEDQVLEDLCTAQKFKFMIHRHKGGWDAKSLDRLIEEAEREIQELKDALLKFRSGEWGAEPVISEAADVANYMAMIAEKVRK